MARPGGRAPLRLSASRVPAPPGPVPAKKGTLRKVTWALLPEGQRPNFVVIQTDDQTIDQLYASLHAPGGGAGPGDAEHAVPDRRKGDDLQPLLRLLPALLPLAGQPADRPLRPQPQRPRQRAAQRRLHRLRYPPGLQPQHRHLAAGRRLPHDPHRQVPQRLRRRTVRQRHTVPPGWSAWHTVLNADTDHYYYGYTLNNNGSIDGPFGDSGSWETREYGAARRLRLPLRAAQRPALPLRDRRLHPHRHRRDAGRRRPTQPFYLQLDYTAPHGDFRRPAGPEPATRHYDSFAGAPFPHGPSQGFNEGNVNDKPRFIREAPYLSPTEATPTASTTRRRWSRCARSTTASSRSSTRSAAMHRLRNTYIIFTSDNGFFYGEHRLTGGKFLAYEPSTHLPFLIRGPGIKPGTSTGELAANIDIAPTILELAGVEADKSIDGRSLVPYMHDPSLRTPAADPLRVLRRDQRRRRERRRPAAAPTGVAADGSGRRRRQRQRPPPSQRQRLDRRPAQGLRGNPPRPLQVHRVARRRERALRHQQGPLRAQQQSPRPQLLPDPRLPPQPTGPPRDLRRPHLPGSRAEVPADARPAAQGRQANEREEGTARTRTRTGRRERHKQASNGRK